MDYFLITDEERIYLRELAKKQLEYSMLPIMKEREKLWYQHNDLKVNHPMIHFEMYTFQNDILPELKCISDAARDIEFFINRIIINHELIGDDKIVPDYFPISWRRNFVLFGLDIERRHAVDSQGRNLGFHTMYPISDLNKDIHMLGQTTYSVDRDATLKWKAFVEDIIGDILPVRITMGSLGASLSQNIVNLMGMETMLYTLIDYPDMFHDVMKRMTNDYIDHMRWLENENLLVLNNGNDGVAQGTFGFTDELPGADYTGDRVKTNNTWGYMDSQETVSISPEMFGEFFAPYYSKIAENFGLLNYACCEPVHTIWEKYVSKFHGLRKVSISPWCDEEYMGNMLRGSNVIFHRKPSPNYVGVGKEFDEAGFAEHILKTINCAKGCRLEFSFRDVYTLNGDISKPRRAVKIVRDLIEKHWE